MDSNDLKAVLQKLEERNISLDQAAEAVKVPAQILRLYTVGSLVPERIVKNLSKLLETDKAA